MYIDTWKLISKKQKTFLPLDAMRKIMGEWHVVDVDRKEFWKIWDILKGKKPFYVNVSFHDREHRYKHDKKIYHVSWSVGGAFDEVPFSIGTRESYNWDQQEI